MAEIADHQPQTFQVARRPGPSQAWFAWALIFPAPAFIGVIVAWPLLRHGLRG